MEVMVALAILTITMTVLVKGVGENASNQTYLESRTLAQWVALNQIAQLQLGSKPITVGQLSGVDQMAGRDWHWQAVLTATADQYVHKVEVSVTQESSEGRSVVKVVGYLSADLE